MNTEAVTTVVVGDVALIVVASWLLGTLARRCGQPTVIGQIVAGIALGPTLLGQLPGNPTAHLFPPEVKPFLTVLAQVAVVIFMFLAGYEIDFGLLRRGGRAVASVAFLALLVPMGLGVGALKLFDGVFSAAGQGHTDGRSFVLFMAVAPAVTALPVLAAIVRERGMAGSSAGTVAMTAAGFMDVAAWLVLAAAFAGTGHASGHAWPVTLLLIVLFVAAMLLVVRPVLGRWLGRPGALLMSPIPIALGLALGSAWVTASLGLHPVFGGFLAGLAMPRINGRPDAEVLQTLEQTAGVLLPLFFVTTGLSFDIGALGVHGAVLLALILAIAIVGKILPGYAGARVGGLDPHQSALVAALVNTRGLTELIVLNVALDAGIIGAQVFTVFVIMALVTTFMTGPLLHLIGRRGPAPAPEAGRTDEASGAALPQERAGQDR
ncbi:cation:proton antiporter [Streptomyces sp. NPDC013161]|uniref:cation:proton antiporter n=1 Tax=Streptomyces sp. NPDC013161 TaxID=3364862 RepID=UPI0036A0F2DF